MVQDTNWNAIDPARSKLRGLVAKVATEISHLRAPEPEALDRLVAAWADLLAELALGEEPRVRPCPECGLSIRFEATRCRYCMKRSESTG